MQRRQFVTVPGLPRRQVADPLAAHRARIAEDLIVQDLARRLFRVDPDDSAGQSVPHLTAADVRHALRCAIRAARG